MKTLGWFQKVMICLVAVFSFSSSLWALNLDFEEEIRKQESVSAKLVDSFEGASEETQQVSLAASSRDSLGSKKAPQGFSVRLRRAGH